MSGNDNIERELESFLKEDDSRVAVLYRKLPRPEPDAKLDSAMLAMARGALSSKPTRRHWMPALSAAAVVLFAAGLAYRVGPQVWNDRGELAKPSAAQDVMEKQVAPPAEFAPAPHPAPAAASPAPRDAEAFPSDSAVKMAKPKAAPQPQLSGGALARQKSAAGKIAPQPMAAPLQVDEMRADKAAGIAAPAPAAPPPPAQSAPLQSLDSQIFQDKEQEKRETSADRAASLKAEGGARRDEPVLNKMTVNGALQTAPSPSAPARSVAAPAPLAPTTADSNASLYPEHWISNIQKMLRENHHDEAVKSLGEFRKKYPDYRLPDDLRDLK